MNYTKKIITTMAAVLIGCGAYATESSELTNQVGDLQMKLQRINKIQVLQKADRENKQQIVELSKELKALKYAYDNAQEKSKSDEIIINNLKNNNETLREQKASLEAKALENQKEFAKNYNEQIAVIQADNQKKMKATLDDQSLMSKKYEKELAQTKENLSSEIIDLKEQLHSTQKLLTNSQQNNALNDKAILSLQQTITTLSDSKKALEEKLFNSQKESNEAFKKQIADINAKAQHRIDEMKAHYDNLCAENNNTTKASVADYQVKTKTEKKVLGEKAEMLIARVNAYKRNLDRVAGDIAQNADNIGKSAAALRKAYKNMPNPNAGKASWYTSIMQQVGIYDKNPNWDTIQKETSILRDNVSTIRGIAYDLDKTNLNTKTVMDENKTSESWLDWF